MIARSESKRRTLSLPACVIPANAREKRNRVTAFPVTMTPPSARGKRVRTRYRTKGRGDPSQRAWERGKRTQQRQPASGKSDAYATKPSKAFLRVFVARREETPPATRRQPSPRRRCSARKGLISRETTSPSAKESGGSVLCYLDGLFVGVEAVGGSGGGDPAVDAVGVAGDA